MSLSALYRHTVTFQRKRPTRDASGGPVEGFQDVVGLSDVPCLVQKRSGHADRQLGQRQVLVSHVLYMDDTSAVRRGDRLYWSDEAVHLIVHALGDMAGQGVVGRVDLVLET